MSPPRSTSHRLCTCALLLATIAHASAHAALRVPGSRNWLDPTEYNKAGNNGRGAGGAAICGDGGQSKPQFGKPGIIPPQNRFIAGSTIDVDVWFQHSHKGRLEFRICQFTGDETTETLNQDCLDKHPLTPVPGQSRLFNGYWWLGDHTWEAGPADITVKYKLPSDLNCDGTNVKCVLQMTYMNGNSCNPPGPCPTSSPTACFPENWNPVCDIAVHERFRNCADVIVTGGSGGSGPTDSNPSPQNPVPTSTSPPATKQTSPPLQTNSSPPSSPPPIRRTGGSCCAGKRDGYRKNGPNCMRVCLCKGGRTLKKLRCRTGYSFDPKTRKCRLTRLVRCTI